MLLEQVPKWPEMLLTKELIWLVKKGQKVKIKGQSQRISLRSGRGQFSPKEMATNGKNQKEGTLSKEMATNGKNQKEATLSKEMATNGKNQKEATLQNSRGTLTLTGTEFDL